MTNKPLWLMDVDGVINNFDYADPRIHADFQSFEAGNGFTITYSPSLMKRIIDLHNDEVVEVQWLTTWQSDANEYLRQLLGFSESLRVYGGDCDMPWDPWWKLPLAAKAVTENERVIWTDDEIGQRPEAKNFVKKIKPYHLLTVSPLPCLTHANIDTIESWINHE